MWRVESVSRARSLTVSMAAEKKAADYMYPMGIERWNPTSWSSSGVAVGTRNATDGSPLVVPRCAYKHRLGLLCLGMWGLAQRVPLGCNL